VPFAIRWSASVMNWNAVKDATVGVMVGAAVRKVGSACGTYSSLRYRWKVKSQQESLRLRV